MQTGAKEIQHRDAKMNKTHLAVLTSFFLIGAIALSACSLLNSGKKPQAANQSAPSNQLAQPAQNISVAGDWQFAYEYNKKTIQGTLHIDQQGNNFSGGGAEGQQQFTVNNGQFDGQQLAFDKSYGANSGPPVHYTGAVELVDSKDYKGPWMHGSYLATVKGQPVKGDWEAEQTPAPLSQAAGDNGSSTDSGGTLSGSTSAQEASDETAPQLSGKWTVAYENNFKTVKSTMYLEQDGTKITGHGVDLSTKEKFTIEKGWYNYPKLTLIRKYQKGKGGAASNYALTFKADVKRLMMPIIRVHI